MLLIIATNSLITFQKIKLCETEGLTTGTFLANDRFKFDYIEKYPMPYNKSFISNISARARTGICSRGDDNLVCVPRPTRWEPLFCGLSRYRHHYYSHIQMTTATDGHGTDGRTMTSFCSASGLRHHRLTKHWTLAAANECQIALRFPLLLGDQTSRSTSVGVNR